VPAVTNQPPVPTSDSLPFRHSEALLRNILEYAAVGMVLVNAASKVVYANRAYAEMLGYTPDECVGLDYATLIHPDDREAATAQALTLVAGTMDSYRAERRYMRKNGTPMWGLVAASILRNKETGEPEYLLVQMSDIDRQKRAEAEVVAAEARWQRALETAGQGVWDHDLRRNGVFYSRMWRILRGFAPDEEVDGAMDQWLERVHPDDRDRIRETVEKQNAGIIPRNAFEYRERHRDGHYIWILSRGGPVEWDDDGTPIRFLGTDTDISSLKLAEAELAVEKEKLRVTLESIGEGVITTDAEGRIVFMNPIAEQLTGWTSEEAVGRRTQEIFVIIDEATGQPALDPVAESLRRQLPHYFNDDAVLVSRSGERRAVRDSAAPIRTPQGDVLGAVLVFQDITHSRALQKELAHSAMHDGLTGLPNRVAFDRALTVATDQARHEMREHALCFIDLDRFKPVNDTAGHAAGDALLQQISHAIRRACRQQDFVARIGGDEFAVLLADCSIAGARKAARQVIDSIAGVRFTWNGRTYQIGASIGIVEVTAKSPHLTELLNQADTACYAAKAAGRNGVVVYDPRVHGPERLADIA
jgi:diguanylate cyclase (GGDEF)-like protein/PAS domain S-box-containing protein